MSDKAETAARKEAGAIVPAGQPNWNSVRNLAEAIQISEIVFKSAAMAKINSPGEALLRMLAGAEMGFGIFASLADVHVIEGNATVGAHLRAASIKMSAKYDYEVVERTDEACEVAFVERRGGQRLVLGRVRHTLAEAKAKGWHLATSGKPKPAWVKTPANMLFARVISDGYKTFAPDLSGGVLTYDPDELDATPALPAPVPAPAGEVVDAEYEVSPDPGDESATPPPRDVARATSEAARRERYGPKPGEPGYSLASAAMPSQVARIEALILELAVPPADVKKALAARGVQSVAELSAARAGEMIVNLEARLEAKKHPPAAPPG